MCELIDAITARIKSFSTKKDGCSKDVVKAQARAKVEEKAVSAKNGIDLATEEVFNANNGIEFAAMTIKDDNGDLFEELLAAAKALRAAADATESAMRRICVSAHAVLQQPSFICLGRRR